MAWTRASSDARPLGPPTAAELTPLLAGVEVAYVCGSARFAAFAEELLMACGVEAASIRVERFGPSG